jgi:hypothetical protein
MNSMAEIIVGLMKRHINGLSPHKFMPLLSPHKVFQGPRAAEFVMS